MEISKALDSTPSKLHHGKSGFRNMNVEFPDHGFKDFLRWRIERSDSHPTYKLARNTFPVVEPNLGAIHHPANGLTVTWIGHATLLVQLEGCNILTDPIFSGRCSPLTFMGPKRYTPLPITIDELPRIDAVVISHNHYDSLDESTIKALGNTPTWFVPLGLKEWFKRRSITNVVELDWWDEFELKSITFVCTPTQHFSGRGFFDRNKTLWCSWGVLGQNQRFWFGGDTGYCSIFKQIGEKYGPFDLAAIPIGAYEPEWFMNPLHVNPMQAVQIHEDILAKQSVGIHWGTFILTDEPIDEPPRLLEQSLKAKGLEKEAFITMKHGETRIFPLID